MSIKRDPIVSWGLPGGVAWLCLLSTLSCTGEPMEEEPATDDVEPLLSQGGPEPQASQAAPECEGQACCPDGMTVWLGTPGPDLVDAPAAETCYVTDGGADLVLLHGEAAGAVVAGAGPDGVYAGEGPVQVHGGRGADFILGGPGDDDLSGGPGADGIFAGSGADRARGGASADALDGGTGDDELDGGPGADAIYGGAGDDRIQGGAGADLMFGGPGADVLLPGPGADLAAGGDGDDRVEFLDPCELADAPLVLGGAGEDTLVLPVPLAEAQAAGLVAVGFEQVVVDDSRRCESACTPQCVLGQAQVTPGSVCFPVQAPCPDPDRVPDEILVEEDGVEIYGFAPRGSGAWPAARVCASVDAQTPELRTYVATARCGDQEFDTTRPVVTQPPRVRLGRVAFEAPLYSRGDTVVLRVDTGAPDVRPRVDLSRLDPSFSQDAVQVDGDTGSGRYTLTYALPGDLAAPPQELQVPIDLLDPDGVVVGRTSALLRFAPNGALRVTAARGSLLLRPVPERPASPWSVASVAYGAPPTGAGDPDLMTRFFLDAADRTGATLPSIGQPVELSLRTPPGVELGPWVPVEGREAGRDGFFRTPGAVTPLGCSADGCDYRVTVFIEADAGEGDEPGDLELRVVDEGGAASSWSPLPLTDHIPTDPTVLTLRGRVTARHQHCEPKQTDPDPFTKPLQCSLRDFVPAGVKLRVNDGCGQLRWGSVGLDGKFSVVMQTNCLTPENARLEVFAIKAPGPGRIAVARWVGADKPSDLSDLTSDPDDYAVYGAQTAFKGSVQGGGKAPVVDFGDVVFASMPSFDPPPPPGVDEVVAPNLVAALAGLQAVQAALDYYTALPGVALSEFPSANVLADPTLCLSDGNDPCSAFGGKGLSSLYPGFFMVQGPRVGLEFVYAHEWTHVFVSRFLRTAPFGRFNEPFTNTLATAILFSRGLSPLGWILTTSQAENMDYNGPKVLSLGIAEQPVLRPFFPSAVEAAALAGTIIDREGVPCDDPNKYPTPEKQGDCVMSQRQGFVWRVMYDLHDGGPEIPEPVWRFLKPGGGILDATEGFDGVQGKGASAHSATHRFITSVLGYLGAKNVPENPAYSDRGQTNLDLVDTLDAMVCRGGMTRAEAKVLLKDVHGYDYDFVPGMSGGSCP